MINRIWEIKQQCGYISNIYCDAANPEVWESLKREFDEPYNNQYVRDQFAYCKKYNLHIEDRMIVVPVPFSVEGAHMLQHAKWLMEETDEDGSSLITIDKRFDKLLTGLRTAFLMISLTCFIGYLTGLPFASTRGGFHDSGTSSRFMRSSTW
jgi:hypothetical protein